MRRTSNGKCIRNSYNRYEQCKNQIIPSCSNIYGIDGWPASTPCQSNAPYLNGISGFNPPNGFKQYLKPFYLYKYGSNVQLYLPHHRFLYEEGVTKLKNGKKIYNINNQQIVLVEDLIGSQLRLLNVFGTYKNRSKFMQL